MNGVNNFFEKINELKNTYKNFPIIDIGKLFIMYIKNEKLINDYFYSINDNEKSKTLIDEERNENLNLNVSIKILWKDLKRLFSQNELKEPDENEYKIFIFLNYKLNEMILSREKFKETFSTDWNIIEKSIRKKDSFKIFLEGFDMLNIENYKIIYEKELNIIHILFGKNIRE